MEDAWDYVAACLDRLARVAARGDAAGTKAKAGLGSDFRAFLSHGPIDQVEQIFTAVVSATGSYWPEALGSLGDVLSYDISGLPADTEQRVRALIARLMPTDLADRVRFLVTEMPWDYPVGEQLEFDERDRRQIADVEALALELLHDRRSLESFLPQLSCGSQRMSGAFGRALAEKADDPLIWLDPIVDAYMAACV
jgi:hypothetical protein